MQGYMVKWDELRAALLKALDATGLTDVEFAEKAGIDRTLVYRVKTKPDYKPGIDTIVAWLIVCREDVGKFLQKFVTVESSPVTTSNDNDGSPIEEPENGAGVSTIGRSATRRSEMFDLIEFICFALLRAVDHPILIRSMDGAMETQPQSRPIDPAVGK